MYSWPISTRPSVMMLPGSTALMVIFLRRQLHRRGAHEPELGGLAGAVVRPAGVAGDRPGDRRRDDDAAVPAGGQRPTARPARCSTVPLKLTASTCSMSSGVRSSSRRRREDACVGAHDVERRRAARRRRRPTRRQSSGLVTSAATPLTVPGWPARSATVASRSALGAAGDDDVDARGARRSRRCPRPMPLLPPVTMAERPCSEVNMSSAFRRAESGGQSSGRRRSGSARRVSQLPAA